MYEALEQIENLLAENADCSAEELKKLTQRVFAIAHEALQQEDADRNLAYMVELYSTSGV